MAERYTDFSLWNEERWLQGGTLLRGSWAALLQWPAARRLESIDYPERDGKTVDFGAGLYDGAPRELRLPLYFYEWYAGAISNFISRPSVELRVYSLAYRAGVQVTEVRAAVQGQYGAWASVGMLERALPDWLAQDKGFVAAEPMPGTMALWDSGYLFEKFGVGMVPGAWGLSRDAQRKRLSNPGYALAEGIGMEETKVVLPCVMGGFASVGDLLRNYGAAWRWFVSRTAEVELHTESSSYYDARYESQRVVAFDPARRWVQFEVTLAVGYMLVQ